MQIYHMKYVFVNICYIYSLKREKMKFIIQNNWWWQTHFTKTS